MDDKTPALGAAERDVMRNLAASASAGSKSIFDFYSVLERSRQDILLGAYRVHAVFEGAYPTNSERAPYRADSPGCYGMPMIEFIVTADPVAGLEEVAARLPASTLLGFGGPGRDLRSLARAGLGFEQGGVELTPLQTAELARWSEDACRPVMESHLDPMAFAIAMADRYNLLYETQDRYGDYREQEMFDGLMKSEGIEAIRAVARARGDAISSDREVSAFMQTLSGAARRIELFRGDLDPDGPGKLGDLMEAASIASAAMGGARPSDREGTRQR